ncbi:MAG: hypothetical protein KDD67_09315 [Ignavibacteriae bacterium]|nr:hypothetical protein [Ignavibacteriota bacterium]MCB9216458.1 hypothetical protein [Ignavibacteria bacterium]
METTAKNRKKFAFLVHPRADVREDLGNILKPLGLIPNRVYNTALKHLPLPAFNIGEVSFADRPNETAGYIIMVPQGARAMLEQGRSKVMPKIEAAVNKAVELGAEIVGLGALTATVAKGGTLLKNRKDIAVTNGNAYTAWMTFEGIKRLMNEFPTHNPTIAFVGATGSVGSSVVELVAESDLTVNMTLVARDMPRLHALADKVHRTDAWTNVKVSNSIDAVKDADLIVLMTSSADCLLKSEHLKPGAIVLDDTQPRNTDPNLTLERPDVLIVDGGLVAVPGVEINAHIGLPGGHAYACLAETMLLALNGHEGHFSLGNPTRDQVDTIASTARRFRHLGFELASLRSFNNLIDPIEVATTRTIKPIRKIVGRPVPQPAFGF